MAFTFRLSVHGKFLAQECVNVFHFHHTGTLSLNSLAQSWIDNVYESYRQGINSAWSGDRIRIVRTDTNELYEGGLGLAGVMVDDPMPPQVTGLISWRSGIATRSGRGRTYMPAVSEGQVTAGVISSTLKGRYGGFADAQIGWTDAQMVIYHRGSLTYVPVQSYIARDYTYTQRRRAFGRGV